MDLGDTRLRSIQKAQKSLENQVVLVGAVVVGLLLQAALGHRQYPNASFAPSQVLSLELGAFRGA
jgi:hypothetical protein